VIEDARTRTPARGEGARPLPARRGLAAVAAAAFLLVLALPARSEEAGNPESAGRDGQAKAESGKEEGGKAAKTWPRLDVGWEVRIDWADVQVERDSPAGPTEDPEGRFLLGFAAIVAKASAAKGVFCRVETRFRANEPLDLQEAIARVEDLPLKGAVQAGLDNRLVKPNRGTQTYPLAGTAFWKGTDVGVQGRVEIGLLEVAAAKEGEEEEAGADRRSGKRKPKAFELSAVAGASIGNGMRVGSRPIGEDGTFPVIGYEEGGDRWHSAAEVGLTAGLEGLAFSMLEFRAHAFAYASKLTPADREFLWDLPGYGSWESRDHWFAGGELRLQAMGFTLYGQFCNGRLGRLGRAAWYGQGSYKWRGEGFSFLGTRWLRSVEPVLRYGVLDLDMVPDPDEPLTWDRTMLTAALAVEILKEAEILIEYSWNGETTGGAGVRNDEFLVQLRIKV
jgi:hypothetical protein